MGRARRSRRAGAGDSPSVPPPPPAAEPEIYAANLLPGGGVRKQGNPITQQQAEQIRANGGDVVVCGPDLAANRRLARAIQTGADGGQPPGPPDQPHGAPPFLPHFHFRDRSRGGHTFYETPNRRTI